MNNRYLLGMLFLGFSALAMDSDKQVAAMVEAENGESHTIADSPNSVKAALRRLASDKSINRRVSMLRIEKQTASARLSAENIFEPMSCEQAAEKIDAIYKD